ncbi:hypothetical protein PIB30_076097 [Stylosanthes scabra]|uniref:BHLH domain-containing protein n=1 Tax=Stylosanthes scabra TaxID=79078 RepID=A0ABU6WPT6_9FABA|nr:hypothetical protein [Stylosanthes scabra]
MFPLQRGNELVIQFSNSPHQHKISQDLILQDYASLDVNDSDKIIFTKSQSSKKLFYDGAAAEEDNNNNKDDSNNDDDHKKKKIVHREIERQRRKEMATLYSSLRSLLPLQFIKGKRSISDHMNEAVNYIKYMQNNIKQLGAKRDELKKKLSNNYSNMEINYYHHGNNNNNNNSNNNNKPTTSSTNRFFTLHESNDGVLGIEITGGAAAGGGEDEGVTLSDILALLVEEEGLEVVSYLSSRVNGRLVHSVQCEVNNSNSVDLSELRRKLANLIQ